MKRCKPKSLLIVRDGTNKIVRQGKILYKPNCHRQQTVVRLHRIQLERYRKACSVDLEVLIDNYANNWNFWVYPTEKEIVNSNDILLTGLFGQDRH